MGAGEVASGPGRPAGDPYRDARRAMVEDQLAARGIRDPRVLAAMAAVPRHAFVAPDLAERAYGDWALPTLEGQTISQPWMVARMLELAELAPGHRVLEIGTGSGYQTALLAELVAQVDSVERVPALLAAAAERLEALGVRGVRLHEGDGSLGWREFGPYDRVLVAAAAPRVPDALMAQTADRGVLVIPVGGSQYQHLEVWRRRPGPHWERRRYGECRFVPLVGRDAWREERGTA
jgi:protein-L-isoaspartate(D-aspartate) O-methyltransferase